MKILIRDNESFGGFIGELVDINGLTVELPSPYNVSATRFTGKNKQTIINNCKSEAKMIFNINQLDILDMTK